ncbi:MAG TPA: hotdog fold thioesterase [Stellaceae bacterium]|nr:hotdog fold thioesterase [Stellaceae bacterium]
MQPARFMEQHQSGLGKVLGITFPYAARHRVIAQLELEPEYLAAGGAVAGSVIMALADCANGYGAVLNLASGQSTFAVESKTNFLAPGRGKGLRAEASPVHLGQSISVWRAAVFCDDEQIADVTQTHVTVPEGQIANLAAREKLPLPAPGIVAEGFSKETVDERWRRIVEGASKVIAAKGFAKATIREIAAAAEMPVATMYQYLERKEDILYNVYRFFMTDIVTALAHWRSSELPPKERLAGAIRTIIEVFDRNHRFIKLMFQESRALTPEARRQVYELDAQYIAIFRELLADSVQVGDFHIRNVELAANFVYFLCTIWPLRFWSIGKFGEETVAAEIVEFVLRGLGADERLDVRRLK